ncbi:NADH-quinone oxidoreductase subunit C 1 [Stieleria maiorica]|uniref:NADH-quinone oxidoreductase subunit C 1 n=1 Tax=Stieleria maiorica TaxID=2795974 RepID=A0A5B9MSH3_9BACT|nr:NADH-quinone oxidoreductase subunit C [Stieleria maiorica]QEG01968.1 NADH-quinone oxidoreductase subunit C 1 [Stieleria maiorica]
MDREALQAAVCQLDSSIRPLEENADRAAVVVEAAALPAILRRLRDEPEFAFAQLLDHVAVDWIDREQFELVYHLYSFKHKHFLFVSVFIPREDPRVPTVCRLYPVAEWQEREVYDLFGVLYEDHPDLRRLFLEDDWIGFPLRKDYQDDFMLDRPR